MDYAHHNSDSALAAIDLILDFTADLMVAEQAPDLPLPQLCRSCNDTASPLLRHRNSDDANAFCAPCLQRLDFARTTMSGQVVHGMKCLCCHR
jgi:hypothetical protein